MSQVSFVQKLIKSGTVPIHLVRCKDVHGRDCYHFVIASHHKIDALKAIEDGVFDVKDYGEVVASGFGSEPSQAVKDMLWEKYQFNADELL